MKSSKSWLYLTPLLRLYGNNFANSIIPLTEQVGVGDSAIGVEYSNHIFWLLKGSIYKVYQVVFHLREQDYYEDDYAYSDLTNLHEDNYLHMIIIKIPDMYNGVVEKFLEGRFSEMLDAEVVKELYKGYNRDVLLQEKTPENIQKFIDILVSTYKLPPSDRIRWLPENIHELDIIIKREEIF